MVKCTANHVVGPVVLASDYDALAADAQRDYDGMREFQAKFIAADHRLRALEAALHDTMSMHWDCLCRDRRALFKRLLKSETP